MRSVTIISFLCGFLLVCGERIPNGDIDNTSLKVQFLTTQFEDFKRDVKGRLTVYDAKVLEQARTIERQNIKISELRHRLDQQIIEIVKQDTKIANQNTKLASQETKIANQDTEIANLETTIAKQDTKIANLETTIANQNIKIANLETTIANEGIQIANLETTIANEGIKIANLETTIANQDVNIVKQGIAIAKQDTKIANQEAVIANARADVAGNLLSNISCCDCYIHGENNGEVISGILRTGGIVYHDHGCQNEVKKITAELRNLNEHIETWKNSSTKDVRHDADHPIAFMARFSDNVSGTNRRHEILVFNDVITNIGNAHNGTTGVFVCPVNGAYSFSWSILNYEDQGVSTELALNGTAIMGNFADKTDYNTITSNAVLHLKQGDRVWIRRRKAATTGIFGRVWSSFQGFRI